MANGPCQTLNREHQFSAAFPHENDCSAEDEKDPHDLGIGPSSKPIENDRKPFSLPDELVQYILLAMTSSFPVRLATITLANCSLVCRQWYRLANPLMYSSPMINMGSRLRALSFLDRLVDELLEYELELMDSVKREPRPGSLIDQMRRLMFFGEGRWRHRASFDSRPDVVDRSTLHEILNRLWCCTHLEALVFVELPFTNPLHRPLVNRYPASLSTLILLTPLSHFELLFVLRDLPSLRHLCIGSHDDTSTVPAEHHTLFSRDQLPSSNLRSFGISARTLEAWLRTGMPWYQSILNLLVVPSVRSITTLHLELADEDDERHLLAILGRPPASNPDRTLDALSSSPSVGDTPGPERLFKLETVFLRGLSSVLMAESLSRLQGIRKLCLSSIYGTALRCPSPAAPEQHPEEPSLPLDPESLGGLESQLTRITVGPTARRTLSSRNFVWQSIPSSLEELSIDITRLSDHGPWNRRSADQLTRTLTALITSQQCPNLRSLGSILADPAFEFGIFGPNRLSPPLSDFVHAAQSHHVRLVQSFWCDSFVVNPSGTDWYQ
ncbi:hypothetical protein PTTG_00531 [Puccinia triticina 1-1 BBBD Race 1]|uniref:F-box domain-containing protein n=2 Tax=Puccinia triticina (isolate 1-1 / race 1 (BBBD)) TaxID=630390 RepID=A0A0C4EIG4_PUCT1|nr:hypothetical protein PTTG_00531 [Puccinia triticina 1-1 BBBD Race 1]